MTLKKDVHKWVLLPAILFPAICFAQVSDSDYNMELRKKEAFTDSTNRVNTVEFGGTMDFVSDGFGRWDGVRLRYTRTNKKHTWFLEANGYNRDESGGGEAFVGVGGLYIDWAKRIYTFSSISAGTDTWYSPKIRIDQDFNFKLGKSQQWVWVLGGTYVNYYSPQSVAIASTGMTYYMKGVILSYRFFYNIAYPGSLKSASNQLSADQGYWYKYMNTLTISGGKQAYMATYMDSPEAIDRNSLSVSFKSRYWVKKSWGFWGQASFTSVFDAYNVFGVGAGLFANF